METPQKSDPDKVPLSDTVKLAIREEVERRFDSPTASFVKLVEDEVRQRIRRQEWYYWIIIVVLAGAVAAFGLAFWHHALSEIPDAVKTQLASEGALSAQKELTNILANARVASSKLDSAFISTKVQADEASKNLNDMVTAVKATADKVNDNLNQIPSSINSNVVMPLGNRLEQLKQQDNILLVDDIPKLFIRELVTNLVDNTTVILNYEPIPSSVRIYNQPGNNLNLNRVLLLENYGYCQGRGIIFTNLTPQFTAQVINHIQNGGVEIEYIRKSLH